MTTIETIASQEFNEKFGVNPASRIKKLHEEVKEYDECLGRVKVRLRSSRDVSKEDMIKAIDRFKVFSSRDCGIFLPDAFTEEEQRELMVQIERNRRYL
jgi:hypothetical protein